MTRYLFHSPHHAGVTMFFAFAAILGGLARGRPRPRARRAAYRLPLEGNLLADLGHLCPVDRRPLLPLFRAGRAVSRFVKLEENVCARV